jgi:hypothetical protein
MYGNITYNYCNDVKKLKIQILSYIYHDNNIIHYNFKITVKWIL